MRLVFATNNLHKVSEIKAILPYSLQLISIKDIGFKGEIPETGDTLEANALEKALFIYSKSNISCFADDTGLEVTALEGRPGVYSARYAGANKSAEQNIQKLLKEMEQVKDRTAVFKTVIALIINGKSTLFHGVVKGTIATERMGNNGFGYDPVFIPEGHEHSFAQMSLEEKNKVSHRSIAVKKFAAYLENII